MSRKKRLPTAEKGTLHGKAQGGDLDGEGEYERGLRKREPLSDGEKKKKKLARYRGGVGNSLQRR